MNTYSLKTKLGVIKGVAKNDALFFRGIPYAKTKRFCAPEMIGNLDDYDATKCELDCLQEKAFKEYDDPNSFYNKEFHSDKEYKFNEELMTLNIITKKTTEKLPVLVFIHGGGFETGCVNDVPYGETYEYISRNIIMVSISYRLNIFGFYRHHNYGLMDQICAINWIHRYIEDFNGDKNKVVIMGQSAGAMSITDLLYTKKLQGLVSGAIMMSGCGAIPNILRPYTYEESKEYWDEFLKENNLCSDEDLLSIEARRLWLMWYKYTKKHFNFHTYHPGIDGDIIYDFPSKMMNNHKLLDIPLIIGVTSQDCFGPIIYHMARKYALHRYNNNNKVYAYLFDHTLPGNSYKAFHCADLWYMMGNLDKSWRNFNDDDKLLKKQMIDYVANFVAKGNPNDKQLPYWPEFTKTNQAFKVFKDSKNEIIKPLKAYLLTLYYYLFERGPL